MKFTLICEHEEPSDAKITYEFKNIMLADTLDNMQNFLKGCGFVFDGVLEIVEDGEPMQHNLSLLPEEDLHKSYRNEEVDSDGRC
jgi:hypothetical protein